jgi:iron complex outermembrane receptor protein
LFPADRRGTVEGFGARGEESAAEKLQLTAEYAHNLAKITASRDPIQVTRQLRNSSKNSANVWSRYDFDSGMVKSLGVGLGVVCTGEHVGDTLKVTNLFDRRYYESAGFTAQLNIFPGAPRTLAASMRAHFLA